MKFKVEVDFDIDWIDEDGSINDEVARELREEIIEEVARGILSDKGSRWGNLQTKVDLEAKSYIRQVVDKALENVEANIARKKAILDLTPPSFNAQEEVQKAIKAIDFNELIDKAIAKRFK